MADVLNDWYGYALNERSAAFMDLVVNHGQGARQAMRTLGCSMGQLSVWLHDADMPDFALAWRNVGKPMLAMHRMEDADSALTNAHAEIHELEGEDVKKASALANLAGRRSEFLARFASKLDPKEFGDKIEHVGNGAMTAVVFLPALQPVLPPVAIQHVESRVLPSPEEAVIEPNETDQA